MALEQPGEQISQIVRCDVPMTMSDFGQSMDHLRPVYRLYRWAWAGLDWLYPPNCGGCDRAGARWCQTCQENVSPINPPICIKCGKSIQGAGRCLSCRANVPPYQALRSWAVYEGPLRNAILRLKYAGDITLGELLARPIIQLLHKLEWEVELVTPVPLGVARQAQRGYNQAALLAFPLALSSKLAYRSQALAKVREIRTQVGLSLAERFENVVGAFQANSKIVSEKTILIVDDVATSGATMQACASALLDAGARQVYGLTLARADHPEQSLKR
jgi:competence protein ComFC